MTKPERLSFIKRLCLSVKPFARPALAALPSEIREEVALAKAHDDDQSIIDVESEVIDISPELARTIEPKGKAYRVRLDDGILTPAERREVAAEVAARRKRYWLALPLPPLSRLLSA